MRRIGLPAAAMVVGLAFLSTSFGQAAELIVNGDFEQGNTGFTSDYWFWPGNTDPTGVYDVVSDPSLSHPNPSAPSFGDHTTGSGLMFVTNGAGEANTVVWSETVDVAPDTPYEFVAWITTWSIGGKSPPVLDFLISGESVGTFLDADTPGVWEEFSAVWNSGDNGSAVLEIVNHNLDSSGNDPALDDISFQVVPEPSALLMLAIVGAAFGGIALRRRKN